MRFVSIDKLEAGMVVAKDVKVVTGDHSSIFLMREGAVLRNNSIERLKSLGSIGVYVDAGNNKRVARPAQIISNELKFDAIDKLERLFISAEKHPHALKSDAINNINQVSKEIVNNILDNKDYMINILDLKMYDDYTYHHSLSVSVLSTAIGLSMDLSEATLYDLSLSGLLHDIGKTEVPIDILNKPAKLTSEEFNVMKTHPAKGGDYIIKNPLINEDIYNGVVCHHEKYDGTGYPFGMQGNEIPLFGKIICVADVYDALTSTRPYRKPLPPSEAIEYIMGGTGVMFDPEVVNAFLRKIAPYPVNDCVKLSNGQVGIITKVYPENPLRPILKLVGDNIEKENSICDLYLDKKYYSVTIVGSI